MYLDMGRYFCRHCSHIRELREAGG
jgi:hypothetical protein